MKVAFQKQTFFVCFLGLSGMALIFLANFINYDMSSRIVIYTERIHSECVFNNSRLPKFTENPETPTTHSKNRHSHGIKNTTTEVKKTKMESSSQVHKSVHKIFMTKTSENNTTEDKEFEPSSPSIFEYKKNCRSTSKQTDVEDIMCMKPPTFLPNYRNPCWNESGTLRCLPYFHIIGVCKSGTTDLFRRLLHHPQVIQNKGILGKETWYWTWQRYGYAGIAKNHMKKMTLDEFVNKFDASTISKITKLDKNGNLFHPTVTGQGDPMDFWDQTSWRMIPQNDPLQLTPEVTTPSLVKHINPHVKLILLMRDPVERLYSSYLHSQYGTSAQQFHDDVVTSLPILQSCAKKLTMRACLFSKDLLVSLKVPIFGSYYYIHLQEWLKVFPREQIFITRTEDLSKDVPGTLLQIFRFLRLDAMPTNELYRISSMPHFYSTKAKKYSGGILNETRAILEREFEPYNIELAKMLKDDKYLWKSENSFKGSFPSQTYSDIPNSGERIALKQVSPIINTQ